MKLCEMMNNVLIIGIISIETSIPYPDKQVEIPRLRFTAL